MQNGEMPRTLRFTWETEELRSAVAEHSELVEGLTRGVTLTLALSLKGEGRRG